MTAPSVDEARSRLYNDGFVRIDDPAIGASIETMRTKNLSFDFSEDTGFDFCRDHVLQNPCIQDIISKLGDDAGSQYVLAHRGFLGPDPHHIYVLRDGGTNPDVLVVQFWPKGSKATYYSGSHRAELKRYRAPNSLWEVALKQLQTLGCKAEKESFEEGGLVVLDARTAFEREERLCYYYTYMNTSYIKQEKRQGLRPPPSQNLEDVANQGVFLWKE